MARNHKPGEIIGKLRETEIVLAQGDGCGCIVARHVWTARRVQVDGGKIWRRFDCGHVSGLLMRHHGRRPRWVPRMAFQNNQPAFEMPLSRTGCVPFVGSTDRHLLLTPALSGIPCMGGG